MLWILVLLFWIDYGDDAEFVVGIHQMLLIGRKSAKHPFGRGPHQDATQSVDRSPSVLAHIGVNHINLRLVVVKEVFHALLMVKFAGIYLEA